MAIGDKRPVVMETDRAVANGVATLGADKLLAAEQRPKSDGLYMPDGRTIKVAFDEMVSAVSKLPGQNLLDNSVFMYGCLVDQRQGYIAPIGVPYYSDADCTSLAGNIINPVKVTKASNNVYKIYGEGYWVKAPDCVRGYTGSGYGIDRWILSNTGMMLLQSDGVSCSSDTYPDGQIWERMDESIMSYLEGKTVTASVIINGELRTESGIVSNGAFGSYLRKNWDGYNGTSFVIVWNNGDVILGAKLELGDTQTLAHQDENGNWVLNELPNYADTLARCKRYFQVITNGTLVGSLYNTTSGRVYYQFPVTMRDNPSIIINPKGLPILCHSPANGQQLVALSSAPNVTANGFDVDFYVSGNGAFVAPGWGVVINVVAYNSNNNEPICWATAEL